MTIQDFSAQELKEGLGHFFEKGFSHIRVIDTSITENKAVLLQFLKDIAKKEPLEVRGPQPPAAIFRLRRHVRRNG